MTAIRSPMSAGGGWRLISLYSNYLNLVRQNFEENRAFEAITISCICLDVLLHQMVDGLETNHKAQLEPDQIECIRGIKARALTAGQIIKVLDESKVLDQRLLKALNKLNEIRNLLVHPTKGDGLKDDAIIPLAGHYKTEHIEYARKVYRLLCHIVDVAGGSSPRKDDRYKGSFSRSLARMQRQRREACTELRKRNKT